ncbi:aminotransferase class V-fold PLP-dependent enzyme [Pikeienuella piscinae]|uniref:Aminotransferase class V-fold PLP-dependent enzyme n=1 Tax=Pikeienuella piscinae TaxID=2748098 RepID=A0A7L5C4C8_9RHOB|nr:aminotransferase class V-fold PLP-dependent enzyme [Pikeienuella piscinae]QIE56789.1 aminotransferase class V-fold PLP-dependent enzyme [Pikeienuella piscinae]
MRSGRHFLQIPGPTNTPERVQRAMHRAVIDHRGPGFAELGAGVLEGLKAVFRTEHRVVIYPASGTGAWEAALVNTLAPGDRVLMYETGQFATLWKNMAAKLGFDPVFMQGDWRSGANAEAIGAQLRTDKTHAIKAVCVVHNDTATGVTSDIAAVRRAMDEAGHPALLLVDTISSLGSIDFRMDEWGVDVTVAGSQKGLMLPPGLSFNAISPKAMAAAEAGGDRRSYWDWRDMAGPNDKGFFPYTPATTLLYGLREALDMLAEEGLENVFARHARHAEATRRAVAGWELEVLCRNPAEYSNSLTAVMMPGEKGADALRRIVLDGFDMSLGTGLNKVADKVFRIGHLGDFNDLMLMGTLSGVEMGLRRADVAYKSGGAQVAMDYLADNPLQET